MYKRQEKCCWESYYERYFKRERCFESERYCERKREVEIFKISRDYEEFMGRLGVEMIYNKYNKYLPWVEADIAAVGDDVDKDDFVTYLIVTDYTKGDMTILDRDKLYEIVIWNKHINLNSIVEIYEELDKYYIDSNNIRHSILNHIYSCKVRLLFDDGG